VNIILGNLLKKGGRFCSALIDSSTAEQNTTPHPCERTSLAARRHIHFLLHGGIFTSCYTEWRGLQWSPAALPIVYAITA
jgi:hypothetical protein